MPVAMAAQEVEVGAMALEQLRHEKLEQSLTSKRARKSEPADYSRGADPSGALSS